LEIKKDELVQINEQSKQIQEQLQNIVGKVVELEEKWQSEFASKINL